MGYSGFDSFEFGTDSDAPYIKVGSRIPDVSAVDVDLDTHIERAIVDDDTGVDLDTVLLRVQINAGGFQNAYVGADEGGTPFKTGFDGPASLRSSESPNGYKIKLDLTSNLSPGDIVQIEITAKDTVGNQLGPVVEQFQVSVPPAITATDPTEGEIDVGQGQSVEFQSTDVGLGVDQTKTDVTLTWDGVPQLAVVDGVAQAGFALTEVANGFGGFDHVVNPVGIFPGGKAVTVDISVTDLAPTPNTTTKQYTFTTVETVAPWSLSHDDQGHILEAVTYAIGKADGEMGGMRGTTLATVASAGDTSIQVATTFDWPSSGKLALDGVVYHYTGKTDSTFTGLTYFQSGVPVSGIRRQHRVDLPVLDINRQYSALDLVWRAMLVDYAEGEYLTIVGRNLGVYRDPELSDDDKYRKLIKAAAYGPRHTAWGLELILDALLGAGSAELLTDPVNLPSQVIARLTATAAGAANWWGKTFLESVEYHDADSDTAITLASEPWAISGVRFKPENLYTATKVAKPSAHTEVEYIGDGGTQQWAFAGTNEGTQISVLTADSGCIEWQDAAQAYYRHKARIQPESVDVQAWMHCTIPTGASLNSTRMDMACLVVRNGERAVGVGIKAAVAGTHWGVGFFDLTTGLAIGSYVSCLRDVYRTVQLRRAGTQVELLIDGVVELTTLYSAFPATSEYDVLCGNYASGLTEVHNLRVRGVGFTARTNTDYWSKRVVDGAVNTADPDQLTSVSAPFIDPTDDGKVVVISGSSITNSRGGNNNGRFVASISSSTTTDLAGRLQEGAIVNSVNPARVTIPETGQRFKFPDDLGKAFVIPSSDLGNAGTYYIKALRHPVTLADLGALATQIEQETTIAELEVSPGTPAGFASEIDLDWRLDPNFETETGLDVELCDAGSFAGTAVTLRESIPTLAASYTRVMAVAVHRIRTNFLAQSNLVRASETQDIPRRYDFYGMYVSDPQRMLREYLERYTAAGVNPVIEAR